MQVEALDLTFGECVDEVKALRAQGDRFNSWLGVPEIGDGLEAAFWENLTPRQALRHWRDHIPDRDDSVAGSAGD